MNENIKELKYDAVVIGGGIAGMQAATDIADDGKKVAVIEKEISIGGRMIALSKVFPTLDCASCITTPKMSQVAHHENIDVYVYTEVENIKKLENRRFLVEALKKSTYVEEDLCIGCKKCEYACPVRIDDPFEPELGSTKAIRIAHTNAIPQIAVLDPKYCIQCGSCSRACPTNAVNYAQEDKNILFNAGAIIVATGFKLLPADTKKEHSGTAANVLTSLQMERLLAPHGPYSRVLRPSDGKMPDNIAYVLCSGSRDHTVGIPYCSRVCCMYSTKQAMLLAGILPLAEITIYYMDIRAFGKGFEEFYSSAKGMGIYYTKAKVAKIEETENNDLILRVELQEQDGAIEERRHDLVILTPGIIPETKVTDFIPDIKLDQYGFVNSPDMKSNPVRTEIDGIFSAGTVIGPKDIVDTIVEASASAMEALNYIKQ